MIHYALLHLTGYDLSLDDLKSFRQWDSRTPGHPESFMTPGVEATTGPLGQGTANAVGMAIAERFLAHRYNRPGHTIVDHHTYALVSDGDLMEGICHEAASLAGHLKLGKLIYLYDDNKISLDGPTCAVVHRGRRPRYEAYGWHVQRVENGNEDIDAIDKAHRRGQGRDRAPVDDLVRTTIGFGSPNKANTSEAHGSPLGPDEVKLTKKALGFDPDQSFVVPADADKHLQSAVDRGAKAEAEWQKRFEAWAAANPELAAEWRLAQAGRAARGLGGRAADLHARKDELATRKSGEQGDRRGGQAIPWFFGGDADLSVSTLTDLQGRWATSTGRPAPAATSATACASTPWAPSPTASPTTAGCAPSPPPSSPSPTTSGRRCGWRR